MEKVFFTTNDVIEEICHDDRTIEIVGYIDALELPKVVGNIKKYTLLKFVLNNGQGKRIQCLAWNSEADRVAEIIKLNMICHLDCAHARKIEKLNFNSGNVLIELNMNANTKITNLGEFGSSSISSDIPLVSLDDTADTVGEIKVQAHLKSTFAVAHHKNQTSSYGIGSVTNGRLKLEVHVTSYANMPKDLIKGEFIELVGVIEHEPIIHLHVTSGKCIKRIEGTKMNTTDMINVNKIPQKKNKKPRVDED